MSQLIIMLVTTQRVQSPRSQCLFSDIMLVSWVDSLMNTYFIPSPCVKNRSPYRAPFCLRNIRDNGGSWFDTHSGIRINLVLVYHFHWHRAILLEINTLPLKRLSLSTVVKETHKLPLDIWNIAITDTNFRGFDVAFWKKLKKF